MTQKLNTVDQVVDEIIAELTLAEKVGTADLGEDELRVLELTLGKYIRYRLDQLDVGVNTEAHERLPFKVRRIIG